MADVEPDIDEKVEEAKAASLLARLALATETNLEGVRGPSLKRMLGELEWVGEPFRRAMRQLDVPTADQPKLVLLLPGFATHPARMRYFAQQVERAGHTVWDWGLGFNWGADEDIFALIQRRLVQIYEEGGGKPVHLVGWSLGGLFARELGKRQADKVAMVISMGSPFSGSKRANNVWRIYQLIAGHSVDNPPLESDTAEKPPVPTVALWSPRDGIIDPRSACGLPEERDKAVALRCTHMGFSYSPEAILAVLQELDLFDSLPAGG